MESFGVFLFVLTCGFVTAGLISTMSQTLSGASADFRLSFANPLAVCWSFFVCLFAGPYIVLKNAVKFWQKDAISGKIMMLCVAISLIWSFSSGILVIQTLHVSGLIKIALV